MNCFQTLLQSHVRRYILGFLMVMVEIYITRLVIRFYQLLRLFSEEDLAMLRMEHPPVQMVYW
jgi:membrane-bound metal-dependent hydrolase YbcI (DUF457 family)